MALFSFVFAACCLMCVGAQRAKTTTRRGRPPLESLGSSAVREESSQRNCPGGFGASAQSSAPGPLNELRGEFHGWLERYAHRTNPWPDFELHLRKVLRRVCDAGDVHAFHVMHNPHRLCPLQRSTPRESMALLASVAEVTDRVVQSIESFHGCAGDANGSPSREDKARRGGPPHPDWSFPIVHDWHLAGVVTVGTLPVWIRRDLTLLRSLAEAVNEQWRYVADVCRWRCDSQAD